MKILLMVFILYAQTFCIDAIFYFGKQRINFRDLDTAIERKCGTNGNDKLFLESLSKFKRCKTHSLENSTIKSTDERNSENFCKLLQESQNRECLKEFTIDILPCLSENEIYIQQLLLDTYDSSYEDFCGINGASNFKYMHDKINGTMDCIKICGLLFFYYGSCTANLNIFKELDKGILNLNKQDVCHDLESFRKCSTQVLEGVCNEEFSRFTDLAFHPVVKQCNDLDARK